jgi:hypothetical protein
VGATSSSSGGAAASAFGGFEGDEQQLGAERELRESSQTGTPRFLLAPGSAGSAGMGAGAAASSPDGSAMEGGGLGGAAASLGRSPLSSSLPQLLEAPGLFSPATLPTAISESFGALVSPATMAPMTPGGGLVARAAILSPVLESGLSSAEEVAASAGLLLQQQQQQGGGGGGSASAAEAAEAVEAAAAAVAAAVAAAAAGAAAAASAAEAAEFAGEAAEALQEGLRHNPPLAAPQLHAIIPLELVVSRQPLVSPVDRISICFAFDTSARSDMEQMPRELAQNLSTVLGFVPGVDWEALPRFLSALLETQRHGFSVRSVASTPGLLLSLGPPPEIKSSSSADSTVLAADAAAAAH